MMKRNVVDFWRKMFGRVIRDAVLRSVEDDFAIVSVLFGSSQTREILLLWGTVKL